ncbi:MULTISPECIES: putative transporter small subunit [unclassified Leucobacter]|nr:MULTISPECIES: putative transporter small subunit [unclassified Leucobacter]
METIWLTIYVLIWPVVVAGTLFVIVRAFYRDWKESRREGRDLI